MSNGTEFHGAPEYELIEGDPGKREPISMPMPPESDLIFGRPAKEVALMLDENHLAFLDKLAKVQIRITDIQPGDVMIVRGKPVPYITKNQMLRALREVLYDQTLIMLPPEQLEIRYPSPGKVSVASKFILADISTGYSFSRVYVEETDIEGGVNQAVGKAYRQFLQMTFNFTIGSAEAVADTEMIPSAEQMANGRLEDSITTLMSARLRASMFMNKVGTEKILKRIKEKGQYTTTTDPELMDIQECLVVIGAASDLMGVGENVKGKLRKVAQAGSEGTGEVDDATT